MYKWKAHFHRFHWTERVVGSPLGSKQGRPRTSRGFGSMLEVVGKLGGVLGASPLPVAGMSRNSTERSKEPLSSSPNVVMADIHSDLTRIELLKYSFDCTTHHQFYRRPLTWNQNLLKSVVYLASTPRSSSTSCILSRNVSTAIIAKHYRNRRHRVAIMLLKLKSVLYPPDVTAINRRR